MIGGEARIEIVACRDGAQIRVDGRQLMDSRHARTEAELARIGLREADLGAAPRVLVGGLGLGFTLRAALDGLPADARLTVVERCADLIAQNRGDLGVLAGHPLRDPRVTVVEGDVRASLASAASAYEAILLDVDNGPHDLTVPENAELYTPAGLCTIATALAAGGVVAIWSAEPAPALVRALAAHGLVAWSETAWPVEGDDRVQHAIILARRPRDVGGDAEARRAARHGATDRADRRRTR